MVKSCKIFSTGLCRGEPGLSVGTSNAGECGQLYSHRHGGVWGPVGNVVKTAVGGVLQWRPRSAADHGESRAKDILPDDPGVKWRDRPAPARQASLLTPPSQPKKPAFSFFDHPHMCFF